MFRSTVVLPIGRAPFFKLFYSTQSNSKVVGNIEEALDGIRSNVTVLCGGFGICGIPETLIDGVVNKSEVKNITAVSNNGGIKNKGLSKLLESGQISKMISSFIGRNKVFEELYLKGKIDLELTPQGTLAERCRAGGAGIPAFYTPTGVGTWVEEGKIAVRYNSDGSKVLKTTEPKETKEFNGKKYLLEHAIYGDFAFVKAYKADTFGNCWFRGSARNFNSVFGRLAETTIVEAEHIVEPGEIPLEDVHLPGIYVSKIIQSTSKKEIEMITVLEDEKGSGAKEPTPSQLHKIKIAKRTAKEFENGMSANLGVGTPTLAPKYLLDDIKVVLQSENGILGMGPFPKTKQDVDPDYVNAGKETITLRPGASLFGSEESFALIRSGKIALTVLGGLQVSRFGDLANWGLPGKIKGMGGAMDLVSNPEKTKVVVVMEHNDKKGGLKILNECKFPLTGIKCVSKIITELAVFKVDPEKGLILLEIDKDTSVEELQSKTEAKFEISPDLKEYDI